MRSKFDIYVCMYIQETIFTSVFNTENVMKPGFLCIPVSIALRFIDIKTRYQDTIYTSVRSTVKPV